MTPLRLRVSMGGGFVEIYVFEERFQKTKTWTGSTKTEPAGSVKYYTLTKYECEIADSAAAFRPVNENSGGPLSPSRLHQPDPSSIRYPILPRPKTPAIH
ncbi:hypothetical protein EVAR_38788_1 [Eumeta japonica]|uniref:Uncharacterized protein n=1 Tax=Eumeta variegata TaxID=151549 RepID=A0A4C1WMP5_EUMVA|nr:hypothetical protein EVAR_38788_1 [Eumeta japonica]